MPFQFKCARASLMLSLCFVALPYARAQDTAQPVAASTEPMAMPAAPVDRPATSDAGAPPGPVAATSATAPATTAPASIDPAKTDPATTDPGSCCLLPDGSPVRIEIAEALSSKTAQRGQTFKLRLLQPLAAAEGVLLPAGTEGAGEVIHAERGRGGGKAGELILAARHLQGPNGPIKLRGMKLGGSGTDKTGTAMAASLVLPLGGFVRGSEIEIPLGTLAVAKLAEPVRLPPSALPLPAPPAPPTTETAATVPGPEAGADTPTTAAPATPL